ncbi:MAG: hypothetical protein AUJ74_07375 [Candidatus Omnitrophica bacterium CG1_02_44_16]|nr:MAG: hypothetical protein AUJ74_07375 [Candidatus Omnitrophica bacterium CG1_02_44_16]PIY82313.1 MAG: hypothetical protein COY78_07705 [Candidatus Omnitrophica bacterium CG_4_10_14_0_8_um_filter_44_12]PIZ83542.1 MAG: hypothetical protein COX96_07605 [Candidatus Omnitrophica bacterium CG_4_10_14_0_2_um_filter_44_9]
MKKDLNIKNLIILVVGLAAFHFVVGLAISPALSTFIIDKINKEANTKIYIGRINVWPLALSLGIKDLKIFDPDKEDTRIIGVKDASVRLSALGLLSKRFVISSVALNSVQVDLEGSPDGTFNIQKSARQKDGVKAKPGLFDMVKGKQDWFSKAYSLLKKKGKAPQALAHAQEAKKAAKGVSREISSLPKGRRAHFKTAAGRYVLQAGSVVLSDLSIKLRSQDGREIDIDKATASIGSLGIDPELGLQLAKFYLAGAIMTKGAAGGRLEFRYNRAVAGKDDKAVFDIKLKDVDLDAARFIYEDSLPVEVIRGMLDLDSKTNIVNGSIDSRNSLSLSGHELKAKGMALLPGGFMPAPMICENLNKIDPVKLNFAITGTVDKPEFSGFLRSLAGLIKPSSQDVTKTVGSLQSLFGK